MYLHLMRSQKMLSMEQLLVKLLQLIQMEIIQLTALWLETVAALLVLMQREKLPLLTAVV